MFKKLEAHKFFPIMAFLAIFCFCYFIYHLALNIQEQESTLGNKIEYLEDAVEDPDNI